ncbi:hypothetical protein N2152v2_006210 [Parachlorella kessleri]
MIEGDLGNMPIPEAATPQEGQREPYGSAPPEEALFKTEQQPPGSAGEQPGSQPSSGRVIRDHDTFMAAWENFQLQRGDDTKVPLFNKYEIDLFKLFKLVLKCGGADAVVASKRWAWIGRHFNPPPSMTDLSFQIKKIYNGKLLQFEEGRLQPGTYAATSDMPVSQAYRRGELGVEVVLEGEPASLPAPAPKAERAPKSNKGPSKKQAAGPGPASDVDASAGPTRHSQRKRSVTAAAASAAALAPEVLVGRRIGVMWAEDRQFYFGRVAEYQAKDGLHQIRYDDGEVEFLDLETEEWVLEEDQVTGRAATAAAAPAFGAGGLEPGEGQQQHDGAVGPGLKRSRSAKEGPRNQEGAPAGPPGFAPVQGRLPSIQQVAAAAGHGLLGAASTHMPPQHPAVQQLHQGGGTTGFVPLQLGATAAAAAGDPPFHNHTNFLRQQLQPQPHYPHQQQHQQQQQQGFLPPLSAAPGLPAPMVPTAQQGTPPLPGHGFGGMLGSGPGGFLGHHTHNPGATAALPAAPAGPAALGVQGSLPSMPPLPPGMQPRQQQQQRPEAGGAGDGLGPRADPPQQLVASGPSYKAFTTNSGPPGFEIFCLLHGVTLNQIHVRCWSNGRVLIKADPPAAALLAAPAPLLLHETGPGQQQEPLFQQMVQLPGRLDTHSAQALFTAHGHLYVRVNLKQGAQQQQQQAGAGAPPPPMNMMLPHQ